MIGQYLKHLILPFLGVAENQIIAHTLSAMQSRVINSSSGYYDAGLESLLGAMYGLFCVMSVVSGICFILMFVVATKTWIKIRNAGR